MPNCSASYCNDRHILQSCAWNKKWFSYRHDQIKLPFIQFVCKACGHWRYIGKPDCAPPPESVPSNWKELLGRRLPDRPHLPTRPDLILIDDLVDSKTRIRIIDFKIAWDVNMLLDGDDKVVKYQPLADMMAEHWLLTRGHTPDVRVVPIVIGACGSIPADWFSRLADLEATEANGAALAKKLSAAIIEQSAAMFYKWIGDARAHGF